MKNEPTKKKVKRKTTKKKVVKKKTPKKKATRKKPTKVTKKVSKKVAQKPKRLTTSKIICSKCKQEKKTAKKQMNRLIAVFGSLELVHQKYHCIECRRTYNVRKDGKPKPIKQKRRKKKKIKYVRPPIPGHQIWRKPEGVSDAKWSKVVKETVAWGIKQGILHPAKLNG